MALPFALQTQVVVKHLLHNQPSVVVRIPSVAKESFHKLTKACTGRVPCSTNHYQGLVVQVLVQSIAGPPLAAVLILPATAEVPSAVVTVLSCSSDLRGNFHGEYSLIASNPNIVILEPSILNADVKC